MFMRTHLEKGGIFFRFDLQTDFIPTDRYSRPKESRFHLNELKEIVT